MTYPANIPLTQTWNSTTWGTWQAAHAGIVWTVASGSSFGVDDPQPVDAKIGVMFNTGANTGANSFSVCLRGNTFGWEAQSVYDSQSQSVLDTYVQLSGGAPTDVPVNWIQFKLQWGTSPSLKIWNSLDGSTQYSFTGFTLSSNTAYVLLVSLVENAARAQIFTVTNPLTLKFDTSLIEDSFMFPRQAGRVGLQGSTSATGAYLAELRPYGLVFAEYQSEIWNSITPVQASRLYANCTEQVELFQGWDGSSSISDGGNVPFISTDIQKYYPGDLNQDSTRVDIANIGSGHQGIVSFPLSPFGDSISGITDWSEVGITLALWYPQKALTLKDYLSISLVSGSYSPIPLALPALTGNQWVPIQLSIPAAQYIAGLYRLVITYQGTHPITFWIDSVSVYQRAIRWSGRSIASDPWNSNDAPWTDYRDVYNVDNGGVFFSPMLRGTQLQTRGQALVQNATIFGPVKVIPKYAQLGRLVFPDDVPSDPALAATPTATITAPSTGSVSASITFSGLPSTQPRNTPLISYQWSFGDGAYGHGSVTKHTYTQAGTYTVTLTVLDSLGLPATATATIVIS